MLMAKPYITIVCDNLNEGAEFFDINWSLHGNYSFNFLDHALRPVGVSQYPNQSVS
jgi:hypothetical protein